MVRIIELLVACILFLAGLYLFPGCAAPEARLRYIYQDVYIPVKCEARPPLRPPYNSDPVTATLDILEYTEKLETVLNICIGE